MSSREKTVQNLKLILDEWNTKIDELEVQAKLAKREMQNRKKFESEIARMKQKRDEIRDTLDKLPESGEKAFEELRTGAEQAWELKLFLGLAFTAGLLCSSSKSIPLSGTAPPAWTESLKPCLSTLHKNLSCLTLKSIGRWAYLPMKSINK